MFLPYFANPTVGDDLDHSFGVDTWPSAPEITETQALRQREESPDYVMEDSTLGVGVPDDMSAEEWLDAIEAVHPTDPDPEPPTGPDTTPPTVSGTYPEADAIGTPVGEPVRAGFSEPVTDGVIVVKSTTAPRPPARRPRTTQAGCSYSRPARRWRPTSGTPPR